MRMKSTFPVASEVKQLTMKNVNKIKNKFEDTQRYRRQLLLLRTTTFTNIRVFVERKLGDILAKVFNLFSAAEPLVSKAYHL